MFHKVLGTVSCEFLGGGTRVELIARLRSRGTESSLDSEDERIARLRARGTESRLELLQIFASRRDWQGADLVCDLSEPGSDTKEPPSENLVATVLGTEA
jgi:hypothetical protein